LGLATNQIVDVSPLAGLTSLEYLALWNNQIVDVSPLAGLTSLTYLALWNNQIVEVGSLLENAGLGAGDEIRLLANPLSEQACIDIGILEDRGVDVESACGDGPFEFLQTPQSGKYLQGDSLTMQVVFTGWTGAWSAQWTKNGVDIPGETSLTYSKTQLTVDDTGAYRIQVTDEFKSVHISPPAIITVTESNPLPTATPLTLFLSLAGIALAGTLAMRRAKPLFA
jgi:hypothetical protein